MYRGEHHPTDVLGAALLTTLWLALLWWTIRPNANVRTMTEAAAEAQAAHGPEDREVLPAGRARGA
jgi:undecaprenyl-diphosphatase